jgi:hypothetical protein
VIALLFAVPLDSLCAQRRTPIAGSLPGTERWLVCLRDRSYNLSAQLALIRAASTDTQRALLLAALHQMAQTDQATIALAVTNGGGVVTRNFWASSILSVEIPPALVPVLRALPRVQRVVPVQAGSPSDVAPGDWGSACEITTPTPPISVSTDSLNHNVNGARNILPSGANRGAGVTVAFFDSGIDEDSDGITAGTQTHPSFALGGIAGATSRILAHLRATTSSTIDCNNVSASTFAWPGPAPFAFRPSLCSAQAGHGTAMAGIAVGNASAVFNYVDGHAPDSSIVDVSFFEPDPLNPPSGARDARIPWVSLDTDYLGAVEVLREWLLKPGRRVHVLNISATFDPDPNHPVNLAIDSLARDEDILVVTAAGNSPDVTLTSNGFYNGLSVGAVHARTITVPANLAFTPALFSSHGPLFGSFDRYYPDVCATGAGQGFVANPNSPVRQFGYPGTFLATEVQQTCLTMPGIDINDTGATAGFAGSTVPPMPAFPAGTTRYNMGTSEAAAQVSGAAALYRGAVPAATAEETRAAILLNVIGTYPRADGTAPTVPADQDMYHDRNTFGVGYVRDDMLALFAVRSSSIQPLQTVVTLTNSAPSVTTTYGQPSGPPLSGGSNYAVVACWPRDVDNGDPLPNVDLEVWDQSGTVLLGRSASTANSYERLVFRTASNAQGVQLRLILSGQLNGPSLGVQLVARLLPVDPDTATNDPADRVYAVSGQQSSLSAGSGCTISGRDLSVARIVPTGLAGVTAAARGDLAFATIPNPGPTPAGGSFVTHQGYGGLDLGAPRAGNMFYRFQICENQMGGAMTIGGIAFRSWRPFQMDAPLVIASIGFGVATPTSNVVTSQSLHAQFNPLVGGVGFCTLPDIGPHASEPRFDRFQLKIPFSTPVTYSGTGDLYITITLAGPSSQVPVYVVDAVNDPGFGYGGWWSQPNPGPGNPIYYDLLGICPMIGLLPATTAVQEPLLELYGEPWIGQSMELQLSRAPASTTAYLFIGTWQPTSVSPCAFHLASQVVYGTLTTDVNGFARWSVPIPNAVSNVDLELAFQAALQVQPIPALPVPFSNALRVTIGGGL